MKFISFMPDQSHQSQSIGSKRITFELGYGKGAAQPGLIPAPLACAALLRRHSDPRSISMFLPGEKTPIPTSSLGFGITFASSSSLFRSLRALRKTPNPQTLLSSARAWGRWGKRSTPSDFGFGRPARPSIGSDAASRATTTSRNNVCNSLSPAKQKGNLQCEAILAILIFPVRPISHFYRLFLCVAYIRFILLFGYWGTQSGSNSNIKI